MKMLIALTLLFAALPSFADEAFQRQHIVGHWLTGDDVFSRHGLEIYNNPADPSTIVLRYCEPWDLQLARICKQSLPYIGKGVFLAPTDEFEITESADSPTPSYKIRNPGWDKDMLERAQGTWTTRYRRVWYPIAN